MLFHNILYNFLELFHMIFGIGFVNHRFGDFLVFFKFYTEFTLIQKLISNHVLPIHKILSCVLIHVSFHRPPKPLGREKLFHELGAKTLWRTGRENLKHKIDNCFADLSPHRFADLSPHRFFPFCRFFSYFLELSLIFFFFDTRAIVILCRSLFFIRFNCDEFLGLFMFLCLSWEGFYFQSCMNCESWNWEFCCSCWLFVECLKAWFSVMGSNSSPINFKESINFLALWLSKFYWEFLNWYPCWFSSRLRCLWSLVQCASTLLSEYPFFFFLPFLFFFWIILEGDVYWLSDIREFLVFNWKVDILLLWIHF